MESREPDIHNVRITERRVQREYIMSTDPMSTDPTSSADDAGTEITVSKESQNWATLAHLSALVMFVGVPSLVGPLVVWLVKKDDPYIEAHAKEALNFNISFLIYGIVAGFAVILLIGLLALPILFVVWLVLVIIAAIKTADGDFYRYPLTLRFVK